MLLSYHFDTITEATIRRNTADKLRDQFQDAADAMHGCIRDDYHTCLRPCPKSFVCAPEDGTWGGRAMKELAIELLPRSGALETRPNEKGDSNLHLAAFRSDPLTTSFHCPNCRNLKGTRRRGWSWKTQTSRRCSVSDVFSHTRGGSR